MPALTEQHRDPGSPVVRKTFFRRKMGAPPCVWTFLSSLGESGFFSILRTEPLAMKKHDAQQLETPAAWDPDDSARYQYPQATDRALPQGSAWRHSRLNSRWNRVTTSGSSRKTRFS